MWRRWRRSRDGGHARGASSGERPTALRVPGGCAARRWGGPLPRQPRAARLLPRVAERGSARASAHPGGRKAPRARAGALGPWNIVATGSKPTVPPRGSSAPPRFTRRGHATSWRYCSCAHIPSVCLCFSLQVDPSQLRSENCVGSVVRCKESRAQRKPSPSSECRFGDTYLQISHRQPQVCCAAAVGEISRAESTHRPGHSPFTSALLDSLPQPVRRPPSSNALR